MSEHQPTSPRATCPRCGTPAEAASRFCGNCGISLAPPQAPPTATPPAAAPATPPVTAPTSTTGGEAGPGGFTWPLPDRTVEVAGRRMSVEIVVVAAVYGLATVWMLWEIRGLFPYLPDAVLGLFGDAFELLFSWIFFLVTTTLLYLVAGLAYTAYCLFRADPVGRGLSAVVAAAFFLLLFTGVATTPVVLIAVLAMASCAVLFVSPWARRTFAESARRHDRPAAVVTSQTITVTFFSFVGLIGALLLPALRFVGDVGVELLFFELFVLAAAVVGLLGFRRLTAGPDRAGRWMVSAACAASFVSQLVAGDGAGIALTLAVLGGAAGPLWLANGARQWFGDAPLAYRLPA